MLPQNLAETRQIVDDLRHRQETVIDLSTGAVLLPPSVETVDAIEEILSQRVHYTSSIGSHEDRSLLAESIRNTLDLPVGADNLAICAGATEGVFLAAASGTKHWVAARPGWHTFPRMLDILGRQLNSVTLPCLSAEASAAGSDRTVFVQSPVNPTGESLPLKEFIQAFTESSAQFLFDLTYFGIAASSTQDLSRTHLKLFAENWQRSTFVFSLSKLFRVPGLRLGFVIANADKIRQINQCKAAITLNFPTNMQHLAGQLWSHHSVEQETIQRFLKERDVWFDAACGRHGIEPVHRNGTHFRVFDFADRYATIQRALLAAGVVCAPTSEMGLPSGVRINLSADHDGLERFLKIVSTAR